MESSAAMHRWISVNRAAVLFGVDGKKGVLNAREDEEDENENISLDQHCVCDHIVMLCDLSFSSNLSPYISIVERFGPFDRFLFYGIDRSRERQSDADCQRDPRRDDDHVAVGF